jgi:hypothetical protein
VHSPQPSRRLPEFKELVDVARSYLEGEVHFSHVCAAAAALNEAVKVYACDPRVKQAASQWAEMSRRVWPEWGKVRDPVTPEEFKAWVQRELSVFDAFEKE